MTSTTDHPCREELRGRESKCNGGAYDGCACGPYSPADYRTMETRKTATAQSTRTPLTLDDLDRALQDERHIGVGYATSRSMTRRRGLLLDKSVIAVANELGLDYEALFNWTNSKHGRWLVDHATDGNLSVDRVRCYLNGDTVDDARP